jgi:hypothetical protein
MKAPPLVSLQEVTQQRSSASSLICLTLHRYPDYDFTALRSHHFNKEEGLAKTEEAVDSHLLEVSKVCSHQQGRRPDVLCEGEGREGRAAGRGAEQDL